MFEKLVQIEVAEIPTSALYSPLDKRNPAYVKSPVSAEQ
jgi:hypothetical protein